MRKVRDIDSRRMMIRVERGKGGDSRDLLEAGTDLRSFVDRGNYLGLVEHECELPCHNAGRHDLIAQYVDDRGNAAGRRSGDNGEEY